MCCSDLTPSRIILGSVVAMLCASIFILVLLQTLYWSDPRMYSFDNHMTNMRDTSARVTAGLLGALLIASQFH